MKLIWLSDLHFLPSPATVLGFDSTAHLTAAINDINRFHTEANYCIITGDLVEDGQIESYAQLNRLLDPLPMPILPLVGNHDNRTALRQVFSLPLNHSTDFIQYVVETPKGIIICLDTLTPGQDEGTLDAVRLNWLEQTLAETSGTPCYLFMHHPPIDLGLGILDGQNLVDNQAFIDLIKQHSQVRHIFAGHVHRPISASLAGIPLSVMRSLLYQAPLPYPAWDWDNFQPAKEAPMFGIILINDDSVVVQYHQFAKDF